MKIIVTRYGTIIWYYIFIFSWEDKYKYYNYYSRVISLICICGNIPACDITVLHSLERGNFKTTIITYHSLKLMYSFSYSFVAWKMSLKLYFDFLSQPSRALYIFLKQCNIPFEANKVNLGKGEHFKPEFAKIHPFNKVPSIEHNGFSLIER